MAEFSKPEAPSVRSDRAHDGEEATIMMRKNHTPPKPSMQPRPATPSASRSITKADVRRSTYTPSRPAGVPARELGLKKHD